MNVQLPVRLDKAAFLEWVEGREERYELDRGRVLMMTGSPRAHRRIAANLVKALGARLDPNKWAVGPAFGIDSEAESIRFPDVVLDIAGGPSEDLTATKPVLIAEILSPSSERVDLGDKFAEYLRLPSVTAYLVFAQDQIRPCRLFPGPQLREGDATVPIEALGHRVAARRGLRPGQNGLPDS